MDIQTFYGIFSATCFALVGLWWGVVKDKPVWVKDEGKRRLAGGVYLSFLIPGLMGLFAQVGGESRFIWRAAFVIAGALGIFYTARLMGQIRSAGKPPQPGYKARPFQRNRWVVVGLYALVIFFGLAPGLAAFIGLTGLQMEALLLCFLVLIGHGLAWEQMTEGE